MTTDPQDRWIEIAVQLREQLAKKISDVPTMSVAEVTKLVAALSDARCLEHDAAVHYKRINNELSKFYFDSNNE